MSGKRTEHECVTWERTTSCSRIVVSGKLQPTVRKFGRVTVVVKPSRTFKPGPILD